MRCLAARQPRYIDDDLTTPRASSFDVRSEADQLHTASMTSSIVADSRDSSNTSPTESRVDVVNTADATSTPKPFRCVTRSAKAKRIRFYRNGDQYYKVSKCLACCLVFLLVFLFFFSF
ncbi:unnamed protein product [Nippostrongylus brasiliensis]|uniref:Uncharacterized protein n=1 Tax=Nippostrongylus brasiliensis TaxID=27835 RepID=A0A3P7ADB3_NIPBR|nr:unnamed protein product [Nippostrongylus brasiliensis]